MKNILKLSLITLVFLFLYSCSKDLEHEDVQIVSEKIVNPGEGIIPERTYRSDAEKEIFSTGNTPSHVVLPRYDSLSIESQIANNILFDIESADPFMAEILDGYGLPCWECSSSSPGVGYFNVNIPVFNNGELTSAFSFIQVDGGSVALRFVDKKANEVISNNSDDFTSNFLRSKMIDFENLYSTTLNEELIQSRSCCQGNSSPTYASVTNSNPDGTVTISLSTTTWSLLCICYNWNGESLENSYPFINNSCCSQGGLPQLDGGYGEAGNDGQIDPSDFPDIESWIIWWNQWILYWTEIYNPGIILEGGETGNTGVNPTLLLKQIKNEELVISYLIDILNIEIGPDGTWNDPYHILSGNPQVSNPIFLYLNGFYEGVDPNIETVNELLDLLVEFQFNNPPLDLSQTEIEHLLTFEPELITVIANFLSNHENDPLAIQIVHDFLDLQECDYTNPCIHTDYLNALEQIYQYYQNINVTGFNLLSATEKFIKDFSLDLPLLELLEMISSGTCSNCDDQESFESFAKDIIYQILTNEFEGLSFESEETTWLKNNPKYILESMSFLEEQGGSDFSLSSVEIITGLESNNLADMTLAELQAEEALLESIIEGSFNIHNLNTHTAISNLSWALIFSNEWSNGPSSEIINDIAARLEAVRSAIEEGWTLLLEPIATYINELFADIDLPKTYEEWYVMASILSPVLLDLGLDFVPIVGDVKGFADAFTDFTNGEYTMGAIGFVGSLAGILPIGDLLKSIPKFKDALSLGTGAFKVLRALKNVSANIFSFLKSKIAEGWKFIWDDGVGKLIIKNGSDINVAEIIDDSDELVTNTKINHIDGRSLIDINSIKNLQDVDISGPNAQSLANEVRKNPSNHIRYEIDEPSLQSKVDEILENGDQTGEKTEELMQLYIEQDGWVHQTGGKYGSNNGYDNVFVNENTGEVLIDESKQWGPTLTGATNTNPKQMSDGWIEKVANEIEDSGDIELANIIREAKFNGKLIKTVSAIKKTNPGKGSIITIKVGG